ncbi:MAG: CHASE3 domain-containing protein, partial [Solirubrobacterales bacterium]|nr:CHASE3 domain-containing protein [Solirubrobacterales bacterium]
MGSGRRGGLTRPTLAAFGLAALLVAAVFAVLLGAVSRVRDESRELERTERTVALSSRLLRNTVDLETGIRGRLLTGDPRYLAPYEDAQRAIPGVLAELDATVTDPAARARFEDLRGRVQGFRTGYARAAAGAPLDLSAARRRALVDEGRRLLDDLRARFDGFRTQEEERTRAKSDDTDASVDRAIAIAVGGLAVVLALLGVLAAFTRGRIRREAQAAQERAAAEEASRMKSSFLANMSHEIRTPLNGVIGMTDLLLDTPLSAEQREYATTARASGEQLLAVINDILDVSKIEAGHLEVEDRDFDLRDTVESTCDGLAAAAHVKGVELAVLIGDDVPRAVRGDRTRVAQVLTNLVSNAVKFTPEGEVVVDVAVVARDTARTTVGFAVTDTGIGIEPRAIERLFDAFSQGDVSTTRRFGGTGLGLAISRQLVELMGGEISARSTPGQGSTFSFTIPFPPAEDEPLQVAPRAELRGLKVLAVDDTQVNRRVLEAYLSSWGMRVTCAADGETALASLHGAVRRGEPYDVALLDFNMPGMDGVQLAAAISAAPALRGTRLVMLTSSGTGMQEAREAGVAEFLTKPVRQSRLYDAIASAMHR